MEDGFHAISCNTDTMVTDADTRKVTFTFEEHLNTLPFGCELDSVRQEVSDDGLDHIIISMNGDFLLGRNILKRDFLHLGNHGEDVNHTGHNLFEVEILIDDIQSLLTHGWLCQAVQRFPDLPYRVKRH